MAIKYTHKNKKDKIIKSVRLPQTFKITGSSSINRQLKYSIVPFLYTTLKNITLINLLNKFIRIDNKYKSILEHIEQNFKQNKITFSSITINVIDKTLNKEPVNFIHQLLLIVINNNTFSKINNSELLESFRITGSIIYNIIKFNNIKTFNLINVIDTTQIALENIIEGLLLSSYNSAIDVSKNIKSVFLIDYIHLVFLQSKQFLYLDNIYIRLIKLSNIIKSVFIAHDLINNSKNCLHISKFITSINQFIIYNKLSIITDVLNAQQISDMGMGLMIGNNLLDGQLDRISMPQIFIMRYISKKCNKKDYKPSHILIGKGINTSNVSNIKMDVTCAASVCSFLLGYALNNGDKCITVICPFINPINNLKPEVKILNSYSGKTVTINNESDIDGVLGVVDCLTYASVKYPDAILINFAMLFSKTELAAHKIFSSISGINCDKDIKKLIISGNKINELLVQLPLLKKGDDDLLNINFTSNIGIDILKEFILETTKWIHINIISSVDNNTINTKHINASFEVSGVGIRLLFSYFD